MVMALTTGMMIITLASVLVMSLAFTRSLPPVRSLMSTCRHMVGYMDESRLAAKREASRRYRENNRELVIQRRKRYYEENKEVILLKSKIYYQENIDAMKLYEARYREENKDIISQKSKLYREENRDALSQNSKLYREKNRDALNQFAKVYRQENKVVISQKDKLYREKNKDAVSLRQKIYREKNRDALIQNAKLRYEGNKDAVCQKRKQDRDLKREIAIQSARHEIAQHPSRSQHLLSEDEIDTLFHRLLHEEKYEILQGLSLAQAVASGKWTFFFGASKAKGAEKKLHFLLPNHSRSPVLLIDGKRMDSQFLQSLAPADVVLHSSRLVFNALELLWRLQATYRNLPLGHRRLYRKVGQPSYNEKDEIDDGACTLYFNCFPVTSQDTSADTVEINGIPLTINTK